MSHVHKWDLSKGTDRFPCPYKTPSKGNNTSLLPKPSGNETWGQLKDRTNKYVITAAPLEGETDKKF